ncbi:MAG: Gfo/Idh/MocA family protein, partial [Phycisphaerales bacterium]
MQQGENGQSRRSFMGQAAFAASAASLLAMTGKTRANTTFVQPGKAKARTPLKDGEPIRLGIIGPGGMGTGHVHAFCNYAARGEEKLEIVALADVCEPRWADAKKKCEETFKQPVQTTRDYRKILERDDIHGVLIASPEHWHAKQATDAIMAGKDVYCEKPMCLHLEESIDLMRLCQANPEVVFQVGTQKMQLKK